MSESFGKYGFELKPRIVVFGVGGAGGNAVDNMIASGLNGVDFVAANTDNQALMRSKAPHRMQLGVGITEGLGAGANPQVGMAAAEESVQDILALLDGAHMVFVAAGMGGGTGTGAAPVIARTARERGILTVAVVTKPFHFEGQRRMQLAEQGIAEIRRHVDTLIVIQNQNLMRWAKKETGLAEAFQRADEVLYSGVRSVTDLMTKPGLINLDFADVRTIMAEGGTAMMGTGEAGGPTRALDAAHRAINNPLLDDISLKGAKGVLINITGGSDLKLYEVDEAANEIRSEVDPNANIILGSALDESMNGMLRIAVVATGIEFNEQAHQGTVVPVAERTRSRGPEGNPASIEAALRTDSDLRERAGSDAMSASLRSGLSQPGPAHAERRPGPSNARNFPFPWSRSAPAAGAPVSARPVESADGYGSRERARITSADAGLDEDLAIPTFIRRQMALKSEGG